ncbi:MAG: YdcF family protein [Polyangiaceae bacterium]
MLRGSALALSCFAALSVLHATLGRGPMAWQVIAVRGPHILEELLLAGLAGATISASWATARTLGRVFAATALYGGMLIAGANAFSFYRELYIGQLISHFPFPTSMTLAVYWGFAATRVFLLPSAATLRAAGEPSAPNKIEWVATGLAAAAAFLGAMSLQVCTFGATDYRRPVDAIVVFGARAYDDGTPSEALRERVETGVALWRGGFAPKIVMSGGTGANGVSEPEVMRRIAMDLGVPAHVIILDEHGDNTLATIENLRDTKQRYGIKRLIAVSHFFHLARIKLLAEREQVECFTVPADEGATPLVGTPYYVVREMLALSFYSVFEP